MEAEAMSRTGRASGAYRSRTCSDSFRPGVHDIKERERIDSDGPPPSNRSVLGNVNSPAIVTPIGFPESTDEFDAKSEPRPSEPPLTHNIALRRW